MAPEGFSAQPCPCASDIWAFGCCLVHMFNGVRPWAGLSREEFYEQVRVAVGLVNAWAVTLLHMKIAEKEIPKIPDTMSKRLKSFVLKCFEYNPADRPVASECYAFFRDRRKNFEAQSST